MDTITRLTKALDILYPNGQVFRLFKEQWKNLNIALLMQGASIVSFFQKVRDSGIPGKLPTEALSDWEELMGLIDNTSLSDEERNNRIKARYNAIGGQGKDYLEDVLQVSFDLLLGDYYIYTETCANPTSTCGNTDTTCGSFETAIGSLTVVSNISPYEDPSTRLGTLIIKSETDVVSSIPTNSDYWGEFWFITGPDGLGSFLELPLSRKNEFIEFILKYKPVNTWVVAQINFV